MPDKGKELKKSGGDKHPDARLYDECCEHLSAAVTALGDLADDALQARVSRLHEDIAAAKTKLEERIRTQ